MGAPKGNNNAGRGKEWRDALTYALENYESSAVERGQALRGIANKVIETALTGDMVAVREIGDRMDGKAVQSTEVSGPNGETLRTEIVIREIGTASP